jgi:hypothetical protein
MEGRQATVNLLLLYLLLLKASLTSFSGLGSLPMVRNDFVVERHVFTDHQLNMAVVAGRTGPGPYGLYLVCVGYLAGGVPGACMGFLALITPAFLVIPLMRWLGQRADIPRVRSAIRGLMLASSGLHSLSGADGGELRGADVYANRFGLVNAGSGRRGTRDVMVSIGEKQKTACGNLRAGARMRLILTK